ncbi:hypothetical protein AQI88_01050 [Streptomyces cellostaticus]|uniref:Uncharacterized protein n=1 Tax=Streptomyces cellostaticus TaxID=67285 RepID=A0A101NTA6_9ACTN|nr:hypothetical protein [Streptomyces cellostaticus]KUM98866.1 hypothetical protein AQI88_01050 [Streptomyces cellostaticus]GHI03324.1 hypothetical protein Scel_16450 [Streptomyces cellostaticus]
MARALSAAVSLATLSLATGLLTAAPAEAATGKCLDAAGGRFRRPRPPVHRRPRRQPQSASDYPRVFAAHTG